jgi:hypothetical protein
MFSSSCKKFTLPEWLAAPRSMRTQLTIYRIILIPFQRKDGLQWKSEMTPAKLVEPVLRYWLSSFAVVDVEARERCAAITLDAAFAGATVASGSVLGWLCLPSHLDGGLRRKRHFLARRPRTFYICSHDNERNPKAQIRSDLPGARSSGRVIGGAKGHADGKGPA